MGFLMTYVKNPEIDPENCLTHGSPSQGQEEPDHQHFPGGPNESSENNNVSSSVTPTTPHHAITSSSSTTTNQQGTSLASRERSCPVRFRRPFFLGFRCFWPSHEENNALVGGPPVIVLDHEEKNASVSGPPVIVLDPLSVGPFGGPGGAPFDYGTYNAVKQVIITGDWGIYSMDVEYDKDGETSVWFRHGTAKGSNSYTVKLNYPDECLISVAGFKGELCKGSFTFVRSLTFQSNKRTYGPFGIEEGTYFSFGLTGSKIIGFHGRSGLFLDSIGAYFPPLSLK